MAKELKAFRIDGENLEYLQSLKEKMQVKSLNETVNLLLFFLQRDKNFADTIKENYPLLQIKNTNLYKENTKEVKNFFTDDEFEILKKLGKENGFSSVNKFSKFLVLSHMYDEKILSNDTINEFARVNYSIKRVGINLNIFLRAIQQDGATYFDKGAVDELVNQIKQQVLEAEKFIKEQKKFLRVKLR
ncbi:TPA: hypothetical protein RPW15_001712 [Campylobacter fetus subsp. venerealis]|nr:MULTISPECIES: hypothetical protein [Campylobacter]OCS17869.1 hypothetical protein CFF98v445_00585 [Campylobacter fetus subsp. fetus]OCS25263.1 hypothetical protein CFVB10_09310 [Campylobacter fetus subsp. venerealis cfvB10]OCS26272.1 hypothetical protein CFV33872_09295 [Campylobacter fetus subsp. venerealis CCUG 33872]OCS29003.1 hypothetical protein CFVCCUG33900_08765 [Campylobacter fetus subsp. venerealis LMG 6570 = CCUG 33900]EAK0836157.1 hypothetical protein [Campylobacter fetus]